MLSTSRDFKYISRARLATQSPVISTNRMAHSVNCKLLQSYRRWNSFQNQPLHKDFRKLRTWIAGCVIKTSRQNGHGCHELKAISLELKERVRPERAEESPDAFGMWPEGRSRKWVPEIWRIDPRGCRLPARDSARQAQQWRVRVAAGIG